MKEYKNIISDLKKRNLKPIYFLMGEEPYYIDKISGYIEHKILKKEEKEFNQMISYGRDTSVEEIVANAKRFPVMAEKNVVIIKEAQELSRSIEKLVSYSENFQPSTILVLNYKYKKLDKRKKLHKSISKNGVIFESKKLYENQVQSWIKTILKEKKYDIDDKATLMLIEFLGNDLNKINNELKKITEILPQKTIINPTHIEENIGISKDYNNFELSKAIGNKEVLKSNRIINYFSKNPKNNPLILTISLLSNFFIQLLKYHGLKDKSKMSVATALKINPFFVGDYVKAAQNYPIRKVSSIIELLCDTDLKAKGVGANSLPQKDILKEMLFKILH